MDVDDMKRWGGSLLAAFVGGMLVTFLYFWHEIIRDDAPAAPRDAGAEVAR